MTLAFTTAACGESATGTQPAEYQATGVWTGAVVNPIQPGLDFRSTVLLQLTDTAGAVSGSGHFDTPGHRTHLQILGRNTARGITLDLLNKQTREVYRFEGEITSATSLTGMIENGYHAGGTLTVTRQE